MNVLLRRSLSILLVALALPSVAAAADRFISFRFVPTSAVAVATVQYRQPIHTVPVMLVFEDGRDEANRAIIGIRTTDDDSILHVGLSNDLMGVVRPALQRQGAAWGITVAPVSADRTLTVWLDKAVVDERNQAVGATYKGIATLRGSLTDRAGATLWAGTATGDTSRYGRPASGENASEVLSDALVEAWAHLLSDARLQAAWMGVVPPAVSAAGPTPAPTPVEPAAPVATLSPEALLAEVQQLQASGFSEDTLARYIAARALSRPMGASDLVAWKQAGIAERLVQQAMALPVR